MSEKISSFLDGELDLDSFDTALKSIDEPESKRTIERYQLIGALMRNEESAAACAMIRMNVADKVAAHIDNEPEWLLPGQEQTDPKRTDESVSKSQVVDLADRRSPARPAFWGGFAAAAAIAGLAVFVVSPNWLGDVPVSGEIAENTAPISEPLSSSANEDALTALLVEHGEFSGSAGINGLIAYAKFVSHDGTE